MLKLLLLLSGSLLFTGEATLTPGDVLEVPLAMEVPAGATVRASVEVLPGSWTGGAIENVVGAPCAASEWDVWTLTNLELRTTPGGWRDGGALLGGLGVHRGNPPRPALGAFDGLLDFQGPSSARWVYDLQTAPHEILSGPPGMLAGRSRVFLATWQRSAVLHDLPAWSGHGYPRYTARPGRLACRLQVWIDSPAP